MQHSGKYLIHADIRADGVVERSDVVGAIFGQTEGLLGDQLDLRDLQESSKLGRIDVDIDSEDGRSFGTVTIASGLDRIETAVLAAALETIERVGPCRAECTITHIEDARAAKRRELVERATELLSELDDKTVTSEQIVEEVRQQARVEEITEYEGLPAGPRVAATDAIIVVEGRADVRQLLQYGIKNAIAVEGTDVPDAVADLTLERNTTAFLDGDRGGDLILRELAQVGNVDYVAFAPPDESVEDLDRATILSALRKKVPYEHVTEDGAPRETFGEADSDAEDQSHSDETAEQPEPAPTESQASDSGSAETAQRVTDGHGAETVTPDTAGTTSPDEPVSPATKSGSEEAETSESDPEDEKTDQEGHDEPDQTLPAHIEAIIDGQTARARLLDEAFGVLEEVATDDLFDTLAETDTIPETVVLDGEVTQRILDVAAQRGVGQIVATSEGEFVKQPTSVRVRTAGES